ncbi:MAG: hypothetical protein AAF281_15265 [Pseudomonadota bacterium]
MNLIGRLGARQRLTALLRQLDRQRALLLAGRIEDVAREAEGLEKLAGDLERLLGKANPEMAAALEPVRRAARRNLAMLDAAKRGIGTARARLAEIRAKRGTLNTYSAAGQRLALGTAVPTLEKRS